MRWRVLSVVGALYAAQFIPLFFAIMALPIILRSEGHSATTIGLVQVAGLPYVFKFLWAPLIDKYRPGRDRYKSWIMVLSILHIVFVICLALTNPGGDLTLLFIALVMMVLTVSTQDVAVDALAISLLRPTERSMGATFQNFGAYAGAIVGGFGFLYLYSHIGWTVALLVQACIFTLPLFSLFLVDEPVRLRGLPPVSFKNALKFFKQDRMGRWLVILGTIRLPLILTMLPMRLMMVDQGMSTEEIAVWFGLFAMSAGGGATVLFGPLLRNLPRVRAIYIVGLINIPVLLGVTYIAASFPDQIRYAIILTWAAIATTDIVMFRGAMDKVRPEIPGFDFSLQIAVYMMLPAFSDPIVGYLIDTQGYVSAFLLAIPLTLVPLAILFFSIARFSKSQRGLAEDQATSTGTMQTDRATEILEYCELGFTEHGITCQRPDPNRLRMEEMGCVVEMTAHRDTLGIFIETPTENFLTFIRDEVIEHIEEFDLEAAKTLRWSGGVKAGELPSNLRILRATHRQEVHPGLIRVTLSGIDVEGLTKDGIHLRLMMPLDRKREPVWPVINENGGTTWPRGDDALHSRFVTIRHIRIDQREIDVDIAHHDGGLISDWAALEGDDQQVGVMGPGGDPGLEHTKNVILAGDTTALPALARLIESVEGRVSGHLFAAANSQEELEAYLPPSDLRVTAVPPQTFAGAIPGLIASCAKEPVSYGWFAGEFQSAQQARAIFKNTYSLEKKTQLCVAYWRNKVPGHQSRAL